MHERSKVCLFCRTVILCYLNTQSQALFGFHCIDVLLHDLTLRGTPETLTKGLVRGHDQTLASQLTDCTQHNTRSSSDWKVRGSVIGGRRAGQVWVRSSAWSPVEEVSEAAGRATDWASEQRKFRGNKGEWPWSCHYSYRSIDPSNHHKVLVSRARTEEIYKSLCATGIQKRIEGDNIIIHNHPCRQLDLSLNTISLEMPWSRCSSAWIIYLKILCLCQVWADFKDNSSPPTHFLHTSLREKKGFFTHFVLITIIISG